MKIIQKQNEVQNKHETIVPRIAPSDQINYVYKTPVKSSHEMKPNTRTKSFKAESKYMNCLAPISEKTKKHEP